MKKSSRNRRNVNRFSRLKNKIQHKRLSREAQVAHRVTHQMESLEARTLLSGDILGAVYNDFNDDGSRGGTESGFNSVIVELWHDANNNGVIDGAAGPTIYSEDFTGFTGGGFSPSPTAGQLDSDVIIATGMSDGPLNFGGTDTNGDYARGSSTGGETTGGVYAFNIGGNTALGVQPGGSDFTPGTFQFKTTNNTGGALDDLIIDFDVLVNNNAERGNSFELTSVTVGGTEVLTGPVGIASSGNASDGNGFVSSSFSETITTTVANGAEIILKFTSDDVGGSGSRDEFAIDNVSISTSTGGGGGDTMIDSTTTDGNGDYTFTAAADGNYLVLADTNSASITGLPLASNFTNPLDVTVSGSNVTGQDIAFIGGPPTTSIGDLVFNDVNGNGVFDSGTDTGIEDVTVRLYSSSGDSVFSTGGTGTIVFTESFESAPGTTYTLSANAFDAGFDYFDRFDIGFFTGGPAYTGVDGSYFIAGQDINGADGVGAGNYTGEIFIDNIDITGLSDVGVSGLFGAESIENFDEIDGIRIYATVDGGTETLIGAFENSGGFNTPLFQDLDLDGTGEGQQLSNVLSDFTFLLGTTGADLGLRIVMDSDSGFEDLAVDNIRVLSDVVAGDTFLASQVTDANGAYDFDDLVPGDYWVEVDDSTEFFDERVLTTPGTNPVLVTVTSGQDYNDADFGYELPAGTAEIRGYIFNDTVGNGITTGFENGINAVTVYIDSNDNGVLDTGEITTTSSGSGSVFVGGGQYVFSGLNAGTYTIRTQTPAGMRLTTPLTNDGGHTIFLESGEISIDDDNFGFQTIPAETSIGDYVWDDQNNDGVQDGSEPGIENAVVNLYLDDGDNTLDQGAGVWINEIVYDPTGTDTGELVEIAGAAGTDLSGWTLFGYNGNGGGVYNLLNLGGTLSNESNGIGALGFDLTTQWGSVQNGSPDGLALVSPQGVVVQFLSYEGTFVAANGPAVGMTSTDIGISQTAAALGTSLSLTGNGGMYGDFTWQEGVATTSGTLNSGQTVDAGAVPTGGDILVDTTTTDSQGAYKFGDELPAATYIVQVDTTVAPLIGATPTTGTTNPQVITLVSGTQHDTADFGFAFSIVPGSIGDLVFNDANGNGTLDGIEAGIDGVDVDLYLDGGDGLFGPQPSGLTLLLNESFELDESDPASSYTLTNISDDGSFDFFGRFEVDSNSARDDYAGLDGNYFIVGQDIDGQTASPTGIITLDAVDITGVSDIVVTASFGGNASEPSFFNFESGEGIEIYATIDAGSPTLIGRFVNDGADGDLQLDTDLDGIGDGATLTHDMADFSFNLTGVSGSSMVVSIEMTADDSFEDMGVDNVRIYSASGGLVNDDTFVTSTTTSGGGLYNFGTLNPGTYFVDVDETSTPVAAFPLTTGNDPAAVTLLNGENNTDVDFGFQGAANDAIRGTVFDDADNDGDFDVSETGIEDITVTLYEDTNSNSTLDLGTVSTGTLTGIGLVISAVFDGPLTDGLPKGVELYASDAIADLSIYGLGSANNGGGTDGEEFTFPAVSVAAGTYIYVTSNAAGFQAFFGVTPDYVDSAVNINGDDAIELFMNGTAVDVFGDINVDGSEQAWDHVDGWAVRTATTGPTTTFNDADWSFSGIDALDGEATNATAATPIPVATFGGGTGITAGDTLIDTQVTDANGDYEFTGLAAGNYLVDVDENDAELGTAVLTTANDPALVTLGATAAMVDFGFTTSTAATPPTVVEVLVRSSSWSASFRNFINATGAGDADGYYRIPTDANQLANLPWNNINEIRLVFSEDVTITQSDVMLTLGNDPTNANPIAATLVGQAVNGSSQDVVDLSFTAESTNKLMINVSDVVASVASGANLDGEFITASGAAESGDGTAGGNFTFQFEVLVGDVDGNSFVLPTDLNPIGTSFGANASNPSSPGAYTLQKDIDGNGFVLPTDLNFVGTRFGQSILSIGDPNPYVFSGSSSLQQAETSLGLSSTNASATRNLFDLLDDSDRETNFVLEQVEL